MADDDRGGGGGRRKKLGVRKLAQQASGELEELLGKPVSSVLGVRRDGDEAWEVTLEIVEVDRIPETTSIMGVYKVTLDDDGDVTGYRRSRRYHRGQPSEDG